MIIHSERLALQRITPELARRIVACDEHVGDHWHTEYPLEDELDPLRDLAVASSPDPIFTMYLVRRRSDGYAVGGVGFFGPPDGAGRVEFGYGLVPSARGAGLATEAVRAALNFAKDHGADVALADTDVSNGASRRVLEKCGLVETRAEGNSVYFALTLREQH
jgi:RimJ/RimL family protein N-acetyltransferase